MKKSAMSLVFGAGLLFIIVFSCRKESIKTVPTVSISAITNITSSSASCDGNITSDGGATVTSRGYCWSATNPLPSISDSKVSNGSGSGSFTSTIKDLSSGTTFYLRAFAVNIIGTAYSSQVTFTTVAITPILTTTDLSAISSVAAMSGGNISSDGGSPVTARGVCWATTQGPTTSNSKTIDGSSIGTFTSSITGLVPGTTYYVRAYATNSMGTTYGNQVTLATLAVIPVLTTTDISSISATSVSSGGNISSDGGSPITAKGVCWSISQNPTTSNSKTTDGTGSGTFTSSISGLTYSTTYYARSYATNSIGTAYGNQIVFKTLATFPSLTSIDISAITATTSTSGGNISSDGGSPITARGVCWATSQNPTTSNSKTMDGTGYGIFTSSITGLVPGSTYYVRAYATNIIGTSYGNQLSFDAFPIIPILTTTNPPFVTNTTALSGGNITNDWGVQIIGRGVCWGTSQNPTISDSKTADGSGMGSYNSNITNLVPGTTYFARAYATNIYGTSYGNQISFTTQPLVIGQTYQGGIIAYILKTGDPNYVPGEIHGLIASPSDISTGITWGNSYLLTATTGELLGLGSSNTNIIVSYLGDGNYAAKICYDLVLNGYNDWYLPSLNELKLLYINKNVIGGFSPNYYWTSTQYYANTGFDGVIGFNIGDFNWVQSTNTNYVRAVRSF